jgi:exodeoxyribonuclease V gamma subunit
VLHLHRAERADRLADALGEVLRTPLADPFTPEVVAVPAKGVERWLTQRLAAVLGTHAGHDGVSANITFPSPARLVAQAVAAASGTDPDDDAWAPPRVLWAVLDMVDECVGEPWCAVLATHLGIGGDADDHRPGRRWATAHLLTELFTAYGAERPAMLVDWARERNTDGTGAALPDDLRWQPQLWRRLHDRLGAPSPAERLPETSRRLRDEPAVVDLPERLSLFGPTRLTTEQFTVLEALAVGRDVHLWLPHPSAAMWRRLSGHAGGGRRRNDTTSLVVTHPLLATLARDTRELQQRLQPLAGSDTHHGAATSPTTLLAELQAAIRDDRAPQRGGSVDSTVQVHACHGPARQVEVLREALLHLFARDPTLEPRDVVVLCPDVEAFAPLVRAAFGQGAAAGPEAHPGHALRVRLADRSLRQTNPLLDVVSRLLQLADARVTATQLLDLAATAPVRRRFGFDDDDLEQLRRWARASGVRWGIGLRQRETFGLGDVRHNTWSTGLDRLLLGVAADESDLAWLDTALPLDDVGSNDIDLAGRAAELVDRVASALARVQGPMPASEWTASLAVAIERLTDVGERDAWQLAQARRELAAASQHSGGAPLRLPDARAMLASRLAGRPTRANFRTGELTVATLVPMRSVPHRVVALLGLDDDVFPRGGSVDGDDVLGRDPCVGERDRRSEDRQLLLDAVMSAGDTLLVLYSGADPVTGAERPPAVPLGELLDVVRTTVGDEAMHHVVRRHPLQPFDPRNVDAADPFSFDPTALRAARAAVAERTPAVPLLAQPLPPHDRGDVALGDLVAFVQHPAQAFLRQRLGVRIPQDDDDLADALPADLDGLAKWDVGDRMLAARLAGFDLGDVRQAELRRGTLPPARAGLETLTELERAVETLVEVCLPVHQGLAEVVDVGLDLGDGRRLTGTVGGVHGDAVASASYSRLAPKHRLAAWVRLLAVAAAHPRAWRAVTTGRGRAGGRAWRSTLQAPDDPLGVLRELVDLHERGLRAPLPMAPAASARYAERRHGGSPVEEAVESATSAWDDRYGDHTDRDLAYLHGSRAQLSALLGEPPADDERAWCDEPTRFGVLARRLWDPLLSHEALGPA